MTRPVLLAALCGTLVGLPLCADDPPKKLTPEERKRLEAKWDTITDAGVEASEAGKLIGAFWLGILGANIHDNLADDVNWGAV